RRCAGLPGLLPEHAAAPARGRHRGDHGRRIRAAEGGGRSDLLQSCVPYRGRGVILNIAAYLFVPIVDPDALAALIRERADADGLRGSVLVAPEGLNLFLAGAETAVRGFLGWLREDPRFAALQAKESRSASVPFARLKVKRKHEIIAFRRDHASPLEAGRRAPSVDPETLGRWIGQGHDDAGRRLVLLDTRNREESGFGTFRDALTLPIDNF